jgi:hypothetical protein
VVGAAGTVQENDPPPAGLHAVLELDDLALDGDFRHLAPPCGFVQPQVYRNPRGGLR